MGTENTDVEVRTDMSDADRAEAEAAFAEQSPAAPADKAEVKEKDDKPKGKTPEPAKAGEAGTAGAVAVEPTAGKKKKDGGSEAQVIEEVKIAGMPASEFNAAVEKAVQGRLDELRAENRKTFGKLGETTATLQDLVKKVASGGSATARKLNQAALDKFVQQIDDELPGMGAVFKTNLPALLEQEAAVQAQAGGETAAAASAAAPAFDRDAFLKLVAQQVSAIRSEAQNDLLEFMHPGYTATLKEPEFLEFLGTLSPERQREIRDSERAVVAGKGIAEYKAWKDKRQKAEVQRQKNLAAAVGHRSTPGGPPQSVSDREAAEAAFAAQEGT